ncbi:hypothetical protein MS3_00005888 [Schistosoma haematobium]|uniref:Secreted protein n=1 Tax=Schistosoma haematobium TaxID=6185 RepID=A0A922LLJ3_SCHHA|nr:hypothetical protein MS3_00005888 [Schistosoma haematobium]KAH9588511.1 hypothetical protein MS3_00005888 [Schistosoma haematobium]
MFFSCKYAALVLLIRAFTSVSDPPCSSMMLPIYVNVFTFSKSSPSIVTGLVRAVLYRRILLFPLCDNLDLLLLRLLLHWSFSLAFVVVIAIRGPDRLRSPPGVPPGATAGPKPG